MSLPFNLRAIRPEVHLYNHLRNLLMHHRMFLQATLRCIQHLSLHLLHQRLLQCSPQINLNPHRRLFRHHCLVLNHLANQPLSHLQVPVVYQAVNLLVLQAKFLRHNPQLFHLLSQRVNRPLSHLDSQQFNQRQCQQECLLLNHHYNRRTNQRRILLGNLLDNRQYSQLRLLRNNPIQRRRHNRQQNLLHNHQINLLLNHLVNHPLNPPINPRVNHRFNLPFNHLKNQRVNQRQSHHYNQVLYRRLILRINRLAYHLHYHQINQRLFLVFSRALNLL